MSVTSEKKTRNGAYRRIWKKNFCPRRQFPEYKLGENARPAGGIRCGKSTMQMNEGRIKTEIRGK
jgi:hypothetical protein